MVQPFPKHLRRSSLSLYLANVRYVPPVERLCSRLKIDHQVAFGRARRPYNGDQHGQDVSEGFERHAPPYDHLQFLVD